MVATVDPQSFCQGQLLEDRRLAEAITEHRERVTRIAGNPPRERPPVRGADEAAETLAACSDSLIEALAGLPAMRTTATALLADGLELGRGLRAAVGAAQQRRSARLRAALRRVLSIRGEGDVFAVVLDELGSCGFDRVMLTRIADGVGIPERYQITRDPDWAHEILEVGRSQPMELSRLVYEKEMMRRHGPTLAPQVDVNPAVHRPLAEVTCCLSYVAAPVLVDGHVVAFVHADAHLRRRNVDDHDRDAIWALAYAASAALERGQLRNHVSRLRHDAEHIAELAAALARQPSGDGPVEHRHPPTGPQLSVRERQVVEMMGTGASNADIARALVLSPATIKTHVANILRKLGATNRAAAVAEFTRSVSGGDHRVRERPA